MAETATLDKELKVGNGWRYQCWKCNHEVGIDSPFPKTCPGCGTGGWWGHLTPAGNNGKVAWDFGDGDDIKNSELKPLDKESHRKELCPRSFDDSNGHPAENSGVFVKAQGQRGPKFSNTPNDLIRDLGINQNLGARKIERELRERGFVITIRTVSRRLRTLRSLPLFEN